MRIFAFDPGKHGCGVDIHVECKHVRWAKLPYREDNLLDIVKLRELFDLSQADRVGIEKVAYIKGATGQSTFTFGMNFGMLMSYVCEYPYEYVLPQVWHRSINGTSKEGSTKERTAASFLRMNPSFGKIVMNQHEGLIDAWSIGYFLGRKNGVLMPHGCTFERLL